LQHLISLMRQSHIGIKIFALQKCLDAGFPAAGHSPCGDCSDVAQ